MGARFSRWRESARSRRRTRHGSNSAASPSVNSRSKRRTSVSADSPSVISGKSTSRRSTSWFAKRKKKKDDKQEESQRVRDPSSAQLRKVTEVSAEVEEPTPVPSHFSQEGGKVKSSQNTWRQRLANSFKRKKTPDTRHQPIEGAIAEEHACANSSAVTKNSIHNDPAAAASATTTATASPVDAEAISRASAISRKGSKSPKISRVAEEAAVVVTPLAVAEAPAVGRELGKTTDKSSPSVTLSLTKLLTDSSGSGSTNGRRSTSDPEEIGKWSADTQRTALEETTKKEREFLCSYFSRGNVRKRRKKREQNQERASH